MADANIRAVITADDRASSTLKSFGDQAQGIGSTLTKAFAAVGIAVAVDKVKDFAVASVKAFSESQDLIAQTNAVLKSTGGIAGVTADQVTKLATSWQKQSRFSDEAVRSAENVLLTFTKISADKFPQATEAVLNLATAMHEDLQSASVQVGKALQDPVLGITALRRVGVNFNDAQKEVVKNLVETGHQAEAQALILKELQTEFGGSAVAAGQTFAGSLDRLKNKFNDLQEVIGKRIVDVLQALTPVLINVANAIQTTLTPIVDQLTSSMQRLSDSWSRLNEQHPQLVKGLTTLAGVAGGILLASLEAMIGIQTVLINMWTAVINVVNSVANAFVSMGRTAAGVAAAIAAPFKAAFNDIAKAWNATVGKLSFHAPSWVPSFGGKGWDVPDIPLLAQGGIVTKPTLAMIGEAGPEAVVPLNKANGMGTVNITFNGVFTANEQEMRKLAVKVFQSYGDAKGMGTV